MNSVQHPLPDLFAPRETYPARPGFKARETSREAAEQIDGRAKSLQAAALAALTASAGLTADEIAERLGESILSIRPRCSELAARSKIFDSGARRLNASGKRAVVWIVAAQVT